MSLSRTAPVTRQHRPLVLWALVAVHVFLIIGGLAGGVPFVLDPSGGMIGMDPSYLERTPVDNFLLPGLFLLTAYVVLPSITLYGLFARPRWAWTDRLNGWTGQHWSWTASFGVGLILIAWMVYEVFTIEYSFLQPTLFITGLLIIVLTAWPSMRRYYRR